MWGKASLFLYLYVKAVYIAALNGSVVPILSSKQPHKVNLLRVTGGQETLWPNKAWTFQFKLPRSR